MRLPLKVINFWAGPGAGKSTAAAGVFNLMKNRGMNVELVTEVAKDFTYLRFSAGLSNQLLILALQDQRLRQLVGQVEWAVTDSPLLLGLAYSTEEYAGWLPQAVQGAFDRYDNRNFLVRRVKPYVPVGRRQDEASAVALDDTTRDILSVRAGPYHVVDGDHTAPYEVLRTLGVT